MATLTGEDAASFQVMHSGIGGQRLPIGPILEKFSNLARNMGNSHQHWLQGAWALGYNRHLGHCSACSRSLPTSRTTASRSMETPLGMIW